MRDRGVIEPLMQTSRIEKPPPALRAEQKVRRERRLGIAFVQVHTSIGEILNIVFEQDHDRQARRLLALFDHFKNAGVRNGKANHRADRLARIVGGGDAKRDLVARNVVGPIRDDLHVQLCSGWRKTRRSALGVLRSS